MNRRGTLLMETLLAMSLASLVAVALFQVTSLLGRQVSAGHPASDPELRPRFEAAMRRATDGFIASGTPPTGWWDPAITRGLDPTALHHHEEATRALLTSGVPLTEPGRSLFLRDSSGTTLALLCLPREDSSETPTVELRTEGGAGRTGRLSSHPELIVRPHPSRPEDRVLSVFLPSPSHDTHASTTHVRLP